ncbi:unnamed protein product, partial [Mesorhabditis spiculigera]
MTPNVVFTSLILYLGQVICETVRLSPASPSFSIHGDEFKRTSVALKIDDCPGCTVQISVGIHHTMGGDDGFPLTLDKTTPDTYELVTRGGATGPRNYTLYICKDIVEGGEWGVHPAKTESSFAVVMLLSSHQDFNIRPFGLFDFNFPDNYLGFQTGIDDTGQNFSISVLLAPTGRWIYTQAFSYVRQLL